MLATSLRRTPELAIILPLAALFAACGTHIVGGLEPRDGGGTDAFTAQLDAQPGDSGLAPDSAPDSGLDAAVDGRSVDGSIRDGGPRDAGPRRGPAPIDLGTIADLATAGAYALIGKTGITNTTGTLITGGHLGVSPAAATAITGFALVPDSSMAFSTSVSVAAPWRIYAADYASPTPANLTAAILSMEMGYTDGAGRVGPDFLNLASGDIGGLTLAPGLYTWGSAVSISSSVTISGGAEDTWIFQVTGDLSQSVGTNVILAGGAQAANIWWVVSGQATIQPNAHFEGIILSQTGITLQTNASLHGRALAQSLVALDDNMITVP